MAHNDYDFDNRLRSGFGSPDMATGEGPLAAQSLEARSPRPRNPYRTRKIATGSLLGAGSLAVVGVLVTTVVLPGQAPLFSLADSPQGGARVESALSDASMSWWVEYEYLAGEGLSSEGGRGNVYQLELEGTPEGLLSDVAKRLGVTGVPDKSAYFDPQWPVYVLGAEDWTAPSINVTWTGTGNWYYNNPAAYPEPVCTDVPPSPDGKQPGYVDCASPEPAGPLVSVEEAKAEAAALFSATGLDVLATDVRVLTNDEWGVGVAASLRVDGVDTALEWTMFWAPGPILASASGHAVTVIERGGFETIGPVAAVDRLASGMWWGAPSPAYYTTSAVTEPLARDAGSTDTSPPAPSEGSSEPGELPEEEKPGEELPEVPPTEVPLPLPEPPVLEEPEIITVTVTAAEPTLLLVWDADGNAWLVPGYVMRHGEDDWAWTTVISLMDGVLALPEPMPVSIMPMPAPYVEE